MRVFLLSLGFIVGGMVFASRVNRGLAEAPANTVWQTYRRVDWWILSARCTQERGVLLVACGPQGQLYPIEDVSPSDDRGHGLVANLVALFQKRPFEKIDIVRINVWINAVSVTLLALVFLLCGMPWASFLCLIAGAVYGIPGPMASADAQATFFGEYGLALTPLPWLVQLPRPIVKPWRLSLAASLSWCALVAAFLLREAIGLVGLSVAVFVTIVVFIETKPRSTGKIAGFGAILAALLMVASSNMVMLSIRSRLLSLPPAHLISAHGIFHNVRAGLGTEPNPWGITYDDWNGALAAVKANPDATYGTPAYYREVRRQYLDVLTHYPWPVSIIYWKKLKKTLSQPLYFGGINISWYALGVTLVLPFLWKRSVRSFAAVRVTAAMDVALAIFLLQGVIVRPMPFFLYPAKFGVLMLLIGLVEAGMSALPDGFSLPDRWSHRRARSSP